MSTSNFYEIEVKSIDGKVKKMREYEGKALLIVNVASRCGFTPQYQELQSLYEKYHTEGFEILGFPCNQFGAQEPGSDQEIQSFCELNYQVTFPMFSKIDVNGSNTHPLYAFLKSKEKGLLGISAIKWNFTKFLVGKTGEVLDRFSPQTTPKSLEKQIQAALKG